MGSGCDSESSAPEELNGNNGSMDLDVEAELHVEEKASDACEARRVGVVRSANAKEKTACIRWIKPVFRPEDPREFDKEELVSVYMSLRCIQIMIIIMAMLLLDRLSISAEATPDRNFIKEPKQQNGRNDIEEGPENCSGHEKVDDTFTDNTCEDFSDLSRLHFPDFRFHGSTLLLFIHSGCFLGYESYNGW
ncbi:hypothetical protein PanWU01x14_265990 [Parasponia andersonii]|uniref:UBE2O-like SH3-B domain-containing protein n=1 Tax=Parasponia andersonii TaxID=3476 RepID=A0A2P5B6Z5_PARAD|nr:hypothetical protein PanWU01x14_265990 [Parasponia andersonii]